MKDILTPGAVGAAVAFFAATVGVFETNMSRRRRPETPDTTGDLLDRIERFLGLLTGGSVALAAYSGTLDKPHVPGWVNPFCLMTAIVLYGLGFLIVVAGIRRDSNAQ